MGKVRSPALVGNDNGVRPLLFFALRGAALAAEPLAAHPAPDDQPATIIPAVQAAERESMQ